MYWQDWSPTEGYVPKSVLNTRPFEVALKTVEFPAVRDGSGGGAIHSYCSDAFIDFLKRGNAYTDFFPWQDDHYFLPRGRLFCPGMPPRGKRLRLSTEG
eukprot:9090843-Pyramimonas_sp.AAC.1